jgi:DNA-binding HxlR family transcriptional regulator
MPTVCCASYCDSGDCLQLTSREAKVCETVCASANPIGFSAVMRSVGYHQEIVSRILRRLINHGAIEKVGSKYRRKSSQ